MARDVEIRATFVDEASAPAADMAQNVQGSFGDVDESAKSLTDSVAGLAKGFIALLSVKTVADYFIGTAQAADVAIVGQAKLAQQLKNTGTASKQTLDGLIGLASGLQKVTIFEDDAVIAAESMLLMFESISGETFPRTIKVAADLATALGTDISDAARQLGRALDDPSVGLTLLRRAGVTFSTAQTEVIKKLVETGQTAKAQDIILATLEGRIGGLAETVANEGLGPWKQMKNVFGDVSEEVGAQLIPSIQVLSKWLISIAPIVQDVVSAVARFIVIVGNFIGAIFQTVNAIVMGAVGTLSWGLSKMIGMVASALELLPDKFVPDGWVEGLRGAEEAVFNFSKTTLEGAGLAVDSTIDSLQRMARAFTTVEEAVPASVVPGGSGDPEAAATPLADPKKVEDNLSAVQDIRRQFMQIGLADRDKELADLNDWYTDQAQSLGDNLVAQEELYAVYLDRRKEMRDQWMDEDIAAEEQHSADIQSAFTTMADNIISTAQMFLQAESNAIEKKRKLEVESIKSSSKTADEKEKLIEETNKKAEEEQKRIANINKGIAIVQAIINTALGISNALTMSPPPLGIAMAIIVGAMGAAQVALIASQSFAHGGVVKGAPSGDQNLVRANGGEMFLTQAQQSRLLAIAEGQGGSGPTVTNNFEFTIAGDVDESTWADRMRKTRETMYELSYTGGS